MLTPDQLRHAIQANPVRARELGWGTRLNEVAAFLGVAGADAKDPRLAHAVERFQSGHPPLQKDGVVGTQTWTALKKAIDDDTSPPADPNAPPPKNSRPTSTRAAALNAWLLSVTYGHALSTQPWTFYEK